jgi:hypothetical protein
MLQRISTLNNIMDPERSNVLSFKKKERFIVSLDTLIEHSHPQVHHHHGYPDP